MTDQAAIVVESTSNHLVLRLGITGMHCASCAGRVAAALERVPGVRHATASAATDSASLDLDFAPAPAGLIAAVAAAGYDMRRTPLRLQIGGMSGTDDAERVEQAVAEVPGTAAIRVSLAAEQVRLDIVSALVEPAIVIAAIERAGYRAALSAGLERRLHLPSPWPALAAGALTLPLLLPMAGGPMLPIWLAFGLAAPVQFGLGARFYRGAWFALKAGAGTMDQLIVLGTSAAWGLSLWNLAQGRISSLYLEPAAAIIAFVLIGKYLEARARSRAGDAVAGLAALQPQTATIMRGDVRLSVPVDTVRRGDLVRVEPGERVAVDGRIRSGRAGFDEALITGESRMVERGPGDLVPGGALNLDGVVTLEATAIGAESMIARIIALVEVAQSAKAPIQRLADRVSTVFVPGILAASLMTIAGWSFAGIGVETAILRGIAVLVVACPCALGLAVPIVLVVALGRAAAQGILIKAPAALEHARKIDLVAFDKTGTLTEGKPHLVEIISAEADETEMLALAGALLDGSEHPLAIAVRAVLTERRIVPPSAEGFRVLPGIGVGATIAGQAYRLGSFRIAETAPPALRGRAERLDADGCTISWLVRDGAEPAMLGLFAFADRLKPQASEAIARLRAMGIAVALLTGDTAGSAAATAASCGIDIVGARLLPAEKAAQIEAWQRQGRIVAMVGDGLNDAPALAAADLGIALSTGTDVAIAAAGATLRGDAPERVADLLDIARRGGRIMVQNLFWAFGFNLVAIPLAAFGLLNPEIAAAAMAGSSIAVVINALRLGATSRAKPAKRR